MFAVDSRATIKAEVERLALAGTVAMVLLLVVAFGSLRPLGIAALPVASGVVAGIVAVSLVAGQVHGLTLGFGTTLIGEAVDYGIYYLVQARAGGPPRLAARAVADGAPGPVDLGGGLRRAGRLRLGRARAAGHLRGQRAARRGAEHPLPAARDRTHRAAGAGMRERLGRITLR